MSDDIFDAVLDAEDDAVEAGIAAGEADGQALGYIEGFQLGIVKGGEIGFELGFYRSVASIFANRSDAPVDSTGRGAASERGVAASSSAPADGEKRERIAKLADELRSRVEAFQLENPKGYDVLGELDRIRGAFKRLAVLADMPHLTPDPKRREGSQKYAF